MALRDVKAALEGAQTRIALLESNLQAERKRAEYNLAEATRLSKLADEAAVLRRKLADAEGRLEIALADRTLAQRALAELVLRFCAK